MFLFACLRISPSRDARERRHEMLVSRLQVVGPLCLPECEILLQRFVKGTILSSPPFKAILMIVGVAVSMSSAQLHGARDISILHHVQPCELNFLHLCGRPTHRAALRCALAWTDAKQMQKM